jgi:hypothetical protein
VVYLKYDSIPSASLARSSMNARFFAGKQVSAQFIPEAFYYNRFPEAVRATKQLHPSH